MTKQLRDRWLCQWPRFYARLLRLRRPPNWDKIVFLERIPRGGVVFDIGANFGHYTALFAHLAGPNGAVHAFEPVPETFRVLQETLARAAPRGRVRLIHRALGAESGNTRLFVPGGDPGQASLKPHRAGSWNRGRFTEVQARMGTLDEYVEECGLRRLDFMKIDVEGAEGLVLSGGAETLRRFHPALHVEIAEDWLRDFDFSGNGVVHLLEQAGYREFWRIGMNGLENLKQTALSAQGQNLLAY